MLVLKTVLQIVQELHTADHGVGVTFEVILTKKSKNTICPASVIYLQRC